MLQELLQNKSELDYLIDSGEENKVEQAGDLLAKEEHGNGGAEINASSKVI